MKYQRHIYGKRQVLIAGATYKIRMEENDLVIHALYSRVWTRVPLKKVVGLLLGILPME